jgi:hypothetical protein
MPSKDDVARILELISKPGADANYVRFFNRLDDPAWIEPLREAKYFTEPPDPRHVDDGVIFPSWPESGYLLRVVERAQKKVASVLTGVPLNDNPRPHADVARIAAQLPAKAAARHAERELSWLEGRRRLGLDLPEALGQLAVHLAQVGENELALRLASALIAVRVVPETGGTWRARLETNMEAWTYQELVRGLVPALQGALGQDAVILAASVLGEAMALTTSDAPSDMSGIWRSRLDQDEEHHIEDPRQPLISALRDIAQAQADDDRQRLEAVLDTLAGYDWAIFRRLELGLLAEKAGLAPDLAIERLLDAGALNSGDGAAEYTRLLEVLSPALDEAQRDEWIALIDEGPTWPPRDPAQREADGISEEYYERSVSLWQRDWYAQMREFLPDVQREVLADLEERLGGAPTTTGRGDVVTSWVGPESPLSDQELEDLTPAEILAFLDTWTASGEAMSPTPEGLARRVSERVAGEPAPFADAAAEIAALAPTYVRACLQGFETAIKDERKFGWDALLELMEGVIQRRPIAREPTERRWLDEDGGWGLTRGALAGLLQVAFSEQVFPGDLAWRVWPILEELSWDEEPTPAYEEQFGGSNMDPMMLSLNTTRGKAMHAVIAFGVWLKQQPAVAGAEPADLSDVLKNLERHLDPGAEPSVTVRGVFGARLNQLLWLDGPWLAGHITDLLPAAAQHQSLRRAVWETFLSYGGTPVPLFALLEDEYARAVSELPTGEEERGRMGRDPGQVIGEHLGVMYFLGRIADEPGGLLDEFFANGSVSERSHLVDYLGRTLDQADAETIDPEIVTRLVALWEWIVKRVAAEDERGTVLGPFGWWYGASILERQWRDKQMLGLLRDHVPVGPEFAVVKAFGEQDAEGIGRTLEIVYLFVQSERPGWRLLGVQDELRAVLRAGVASEVAADRFRVREIVNLLAARGMTGFIDVLDDGQSGD